MSLRQTIRRWSCNVVYKRWICPQEAWRRATMILRSSHTFRPWQEKFLRAVPTPLMKLVWMSLRAVFGKGDNVHFFMSGFLTLWQSCLNQKLYTAFSSNENVKKATVQPANCWSRAWLLQPSELVLKLSEKKQIDYSIAISWQREKLSFNLLRSAVLCVRGSRTTRHELNSDFSGVEIGNVIGTIK